jgi:hypothetical protein
VAAATAGALIFARRAYHLWKTKNTARANARKARGVIPFYFFAEIKHRENGKVRESDDLHRGSRDAPAMAAEPLTPTMDAPRPAGFRRFRAVALSLMPDSAQRHSAAVHPAGGIPLK